MNTAAVPELQLSLSDASVGRAAAGYLWAQQNLLDRFGTSGHELQRIADEAAQRVNRQAICGDGTFNRSATYNPNDSCDEFAFAASRQSGAQFGLRGSACAEIAPYQDNGAWYVESIKVTGTERCSRAHVENSINVNAGRKLSGLTVGQRLLDGDKYLLTVTG